MGQFGSLSKNERELGGNERETDRLRLERVDVGREDRLGEGGVRLHENGVSASNFPRKIPARTSSV